MKRNILLCFILTGILFSCSKSNSSDENSGYSATPATLQIPQLFQQLLPPPTIPSNNPLTEEGIALGRKLFYDPILSGDGSQSCASCHLQANGFTDPRQFSIGIDGSVGNRNAMPIFNIVWSVNQQFFWDGRAHSVEDQALGPVENPIEMKNTWQQAVSSLQNHSQYPDLFNQAFGTPTITKDLVVKAIAQFERTLISGDAPFDRYLLGDTNAVSASVINGFNIFMDPERGDCFHCHGSDTNPLWTDNIFHNNGLDETFTDKGLGDVTGDPLDFGKFKSPSLRNLAYTAPYMHDGRFATLDQVIDHYSEGLVYSETIDPLMKFVAAGGIHLTPQEKQDLKAFLLSLSEESFTTNPAFQNPN